MSYKLKISNKTEWSVVKYLQNIRSIYGKEKVQDVCSRYHLFHHPKESIRPLKIDHVRQIQIGLNDITGQDLDKILKNLRCGNLCSMIEKDALAKLGKEKKEQLKAYLKASELPAQLFNDLLGALRETSEEYQQIQFTQLPISKISGIPGKYFQHGWISHRSGRNLEDEERLRLYAEIESFESHQQAAYCELMAKILVKKHLYYENKGSNEMKLGMLIPGLKGPDGRPRWYRVNEIIDSGLGKFAYRLVPATTKYSADMPDFLLYRSSATLPTAMDSFSSYLNDFNVLPPGYLSRQSCQKQELRWMTEATPCVDGSTRPLIMTGHSLGASHCQVALMSLQKSGQWPNRKISLELFDSPAIRAKDAKMFAESFEKLDQSRKSLTLNYYVSKRDLVPLFGSLQSSSYLGNYMRKNKAVGIVHKMQLTKKRK